LASKQVEDAFALFDLERRPLIDEVVLKERYMRLAAARHPDLSGGDDEQFHLLQNAYKTLGDPAARLRHLMELVFRGAEVRDDSAPHAELFMCAAGAVHAARAVLSRLENRGTRLGRALLSAEIASALEQVRAAMASVRKTRSELTARLESLDLRWPDVSAGELAALASSFSFLSRWASELSESEFRLAHG
jgi:curved DNA-binding protein CbpA